MISRSIVLRDVDAKLPHAEVAKAAAALNRQCSEHLGPVWNVDVAVRAETLHAPAQPGEWLCELHDQPPPTVEGALGFHDRMPTGEMVLYVFVGLCRDNGTTWTSCASHEIAETVVDPRLRRGAQAPDGTWYAQETSDACEAVSYTIDGVAVSDFCWPAWFEPELDADGEPIAGEQYDQCSKCTKPFEVLDGGYAQTWDQTSGWKQLGAMSAYRQTLHDRGMSRGMRRGTVIAS